MQRLPVIVLKRHEDRRLRAGHLWVYGSEIDPTRSALADIEPGAAVLVQDSAGEALGIGYANPRSLIAVRLLSRNPHSALDAALIERRLRAALALRTRLWAQPFYRLVHGEGDGLPGLIIDRYGDYAVAQFNTAGMQRLENRVLEALHAVCAPHAVLLRNDSAVRVLEGLPQIIDTKGDVPDCIAIDEDGLRFEVPLAGGQKTGWYFDQRDNRARLARYADGRRMLDVFSYLGGFGLHAARAGAESVLCLDASAAALDGTLRNAAENGLAERVAVRAGDAFDSLRELAQARQQFDLIVLDPPAFIKRKKDEPEGLIAYRRLNKLALRLLAPDGVLVSCSCSAHLPRAALADTVRRGAAALGRFVQILEYGQQAPDHPIHPAIPETEYLKAVYARALP